jgi:protein-S-isoprenylcysteine O-methyltransferase Ste14
MFTYASRAPGAVFEGAAGTSLMRAILALRAILFVFLIPGTVAVFIPLRILRVAGHLHLPAASIAACGAGALILAGSAVLLACVWEFFASGQGTLAPIDPPRQLVVTGLYRFTRNPMYNGVLVMLLGEAWLFHSFEVLRYAAGFVVTVHLFVVLYEERTLRSRFGESFRSYRAAVPRWGFTFTPYPANRAGSV